MVQLTHLWKNSLSCFFSNLFCLIHLVWSRSWQVYVTTVLLMSALFGALAWYSTLPPVAVLGSFFSLPVPVPAMVLSAFYLPALIALHERGRAVRKWWQSMLASLLFYASVGGGLLGAHYLYAQASPLLRTVMAVLALACIPVLLFFLLISPFWALALAYRPMALRSERERFRHSVYMTFAELPALVLMLLLLTPLAALVYYVPAVLVEYLELAPSWCLPIMHLFSILYWQVGWAVCIVFYQERKQLY